MKIERKPGLKALALALSLSALLLPVSCSKDTTGETEGPGKTLSGDVPIRFKAAFGEEGTKGTGTMTTASLDDFGVFAAYVPEGGDPDRLDKSYMMNVPYRRTSDGRYDSTPSRYWPVAGTMTFFALAPYDSTVLNLVDIDEIRGSKRPSIIWNPDPDPARQTDICLAVAANQPRGLEVPLEFHHATAQIYFTANYVELADNEFLIVDTVIIRNIIGRKKVSIVSEPPYVEWEDDRGLPRDMDYMLTRADGHLNDLHVPQENDAPRGEEITTEEGCLFLVPQTYDASSSNIELEVKYTQYYQRPDIGASVDTMRHTALETVMPSCVWEPDRRYRFILSINDKTQWLNAAFDPDEYVGKPADYYAMVCSFENSSLTKVEGDVFEWVATVGPRDISSYNKEVLWTAEPADYVKIEYKAVYDGRVSDPDDVTGMSRDTVMITCLKPTSDISPETVVTIRATTIHAADETGYKTAEMKMTINGVGLTISPYPSGAVTW